MPDQGRISVAQVAMLLWIMRVAVSFLVPGSIASAKRDAWLGELAITAARQIILVVILLLAARFPGQTLVGVGRTVLGRVGGFLFGLIYAGYFVWFAAAVLRSFTDFLLSTIAPMLPISVAILVLALVSMYAARHGVEVLGRAGEIIFPLMLLGTLLPMLLSLDDANPDWLLPVLENGLYPLYLAGVGTGPLIGELPFLITLVALMRDRRGLRPSLHLMLLAAGLLHAASVATLILVSGEHIAMTSNYPIHILVRQIQVGDLIERVDPLFTMVIVAGYFVRVAMFLYAASVTAAETLNLGEYRPLVLPILTIVVPFAIFGWENQQQFKEETSAVLPAYFWCLNLVIPVCVMLIALLRGVRGSDVNQPASPSTG